MTTQEIASRLAALCAQGEFEKAQKELYSEDAVSIEPFASGGYEKETHGLAGIVEKGHKFQADVLETFGITVSTPIVAGNSFALTLTMDLTMKEHGRIQMVEICVYTVKDGKVIAEQFFM